MKILSPLPAAKGTLRVTEAYACIEGEGRTAGAKTWLLRLSGCNLRCWWCDSKYSSFDESEAKEIGVKEIIKQANKELLPWLSVTGGEPTFRAADEMQSLAELLNAAQEAGMKTKLESNGLAFPSLLIPFVDLWSISPKWDARAALAKAEDDHPGLWGRTAAMDYDEQILALMTQTLPAGALQIKFIICADEAGKPLQSDLKEAAYILSSLSSEKIKMLPIFLIPQAYEADGTWDRDRYLLRIENLERAADKLKDAPWAGLDLRVQAQRHRLLHGDERGV